MNALLILIPLSLAMGLVGLRAFLWSASKGQFDDPDGNAWRVILNDARQGPGQAALRRKEADADERASERERTLGLIALNFE